ncbi:hypothetical protein BGX28_009288 [Mortierella sp. GBA30]|nr:hypothetical protein BGX28_009288 [Mortierella sp. GBA30]
MNTTTPYDHPQQQQLRQQQQQGYGSRQLSSSALLTHKASPYGTPTSSSTSSLNLNASVGRPLPRAPVMQQQQQQQQHLNLPTPTGANTVSHRYGSVNHQNFGSNTNSSSSGLYVNNSSFSSAAVVNSGKNSTLSARSNINSHTSQPSTTSMTSMSSSNVTNTMGAGVGPKPGHSSWMHPKVTTSASTSISSIQSMTPPSVPSGVTTGTAYSGTSMLNKRTSQSHLFQQLQPQTSSSGQQGLSQEEESGYYTALTRPISPTMVMNYIPPPASTVTPSSSSSIRPLSATALLSASFNTLGPGSQIAQEPTSHQGARSSYISQSSAAPPKTTQPASSGPVTTLTSVVGPSSSMMNAEDPTSNSSRFARRGPLVTGHENGSFTEGIDSGINSTATESRRQSAAYSSDADSPAQTQYRHSMHGQQPFSPASQRTDVVGGSSPGSTTVMGMQLQIAKEGWLWRRGNLLTWKRCYAIGRYRGDAHPGIMTLFKDNEHLFPIKTIDMSECFEVQVKAQDAKGTGRFEFKVVTRKEETWFATDTMSERTGWIDALNSLMAKVVGASLMKLEQKLNNIRHRNNSLEYAHTTLSTDKSSLDGHLQLVQQDLVSREQLLSQREQELERKRIESLLVQLEAWRAAAKVTVNQHYSVRDQLLERVMKTARTFQELQERAKIHLETGSDQVTEVVNSHLDCLKVHASETSLNQASFKMLKSILLGLTVNLDTRSSEIKRVLLVLEQHISATKASSLTRRSSSSSLTSPRLAGSNANGRERRISMAETPHQKTPSPTPPLVGTSVYLIQMREKYTETLDVLEDHSTKLKRILERADVQSSESSRQFHEEARGTLKGLLHLPSYAFTPCVPDQPLPGAVDTFYREDLVQLQQKSQEILRRGQSLNGQLTSAQSAETPDRDQGSESNESAATEKVVTPPSSPKESASPSIANGTLLKSQQTTTVISSNASTGPPTLSLALPSSLSSFLLPDIASVTASVPAATRTSTTDLTQRLRDTILPEFDHLSIKQEESTLSMTSLLNQISALLVDKLTEIKDATSSQRQEFEELKDEIIDVMQLSATDPSAHQRDISALSEIRSKLAEITEQLTKVQNAQSSEAGGGLLSYYGSGASSSYRRLGPPNSTVSNSTGGGGSSATATGFSLLQRSASTMGHSSLSSGGGAHPFYHTIDSGPRQHLQRVNSTSLQSRLHLPTSASMVAGLGTGGLASMSGSRHPKIAGMAQKFEESDVARGGNIGGSTPTMPTISTGPFISEGVDHEMDTLVRHYNQQSQKEVVSKLDQLLLLLEFVNTAQCRMMAYQDLEFDRHQKRAGSSNIDDDRMMAVQGHMEQMDRKMNLQMHLLRRIVSLQGSTPSTVLASKDSGETEYETIVADSTRIQEVTGEEMVEVPVSTDEPVEGQTIAKTLSSSSLQEVESLVKVLPSEKELSLVEILDRLDLQVIPSVNDQSDRIHELSDQLSELKRQLDEQQRRQENLHNLSLQPKLGNSNSNTLRPRVSTSSSIDRSKSLDRSTTTALQHTRSLSQTLLQQTGSNSSGFGSSLQSPLESESPASWRASLRPSQSNGSNVVGSSLRERSGPQSSSSHSNPMSNVVSSGMSLQETTTTTATAQQSGQWNHSLQHQPSFGSSSTLITKTSDRIAEILERMDARMGQVIDEQLSRYEKGNKELLAKVYELLDAEEDDEEEDDVKVYSKSQQNTSPRRSASSIRPTSAIASASDLSDISSRPELGLQLSTTSDMREMLEKVLKIQEDILKANEDRRLQRSSRLKETEGALDGEEDHDKGNEEGEEVTMATLHHSSTALSREMTDALDKVKMLVQQEGDRSESLLNEQRDDVLEKMNQLMSLIQESNADQGDRDAKLKEELQEMREWVVRHSSLQTENLREIFVLAATTTAITTTTPMTTTTTLTASEEMSLQSTRGVTDESGGEVDGVLVGRDSMSGTASSGGGSDEDEYAAIDISSGSLEQDRKRALVHEDDNISDNRLPQGVFAIADTTSVSEIKELKEQLETFTKIQMATFSELVDNVSGVEKMMRDMSKVMGVRRGGTILRKKEAEQGRAMLAMEVKETIEEVMTRRMGSTTVVTPQQQQEYTLQSMERWSTTSSGSLPHSIDGERQSVEGNQPSNVNKNEGSSSGLLRYLYQPRRSTSMFSTTSPPPSATPSAANYRSSTFSSGMTIDTAIRGTEPSPASLQSPTTFLISENLPGEDRRDEAEAMSTRNARLQMQMHLESYQDQIEQLYRRKARAEMEVEDLQSEKQRLIDEKDQLRKEVEQLRKDKQELLLEKTETGVVSPEMSADKVLEKMLQGRVAMLLQETARLEVAKSRLEGRS